MPRRLLQARQTTSMSARDRHYFASLLIAAGLDVKVVQSRLRHASAMTTLNTYGHMFPDKDESARAAVAFAIASRADSVRTEGLATPS